MESSSDSAALRSVTGMKWSDQGFRIVGLTHEIVL
jgi:hypothetical protein